MSVANLYRESCSVCVLLGGSGTRLIVAQKQLDVCTLLKPRTARMDAGQCRWFSLPYRGWLIAMIDLYRKCVSARADEAAQDDPERALEMIGQFE